MSVENAAATRGPGPIRQVLNPIRGQLIVAVMLAAAGAMLTLLPLAGIAAIIRLVLVDPADELAPGTAAGPAAGLAAGIAADVGWILAASIAGLFVGMALLSAGQMTAHLADNRNTTRLRLAVVQRLARVPLGWFTQRTSGEVKQALQDDIATLHGLTAHFYTTAARAGGTILVAVIYLFLQDWRMTLFTLLPVAGFFLFLRHALKASAANLADFVLGLGRINTAMVEFVDGMPVHKTFGDAGKAHRGYRDAVDGFAEAFRQFTRPLVAAMAHAHAMIAPVTLLGVVLASGSWLVGMGWLAPVDVVPFVLVAPVIGAPLLLLHTLLHDLDSARGAAQRVLALLATPVLELPAPDRQQIPTGHEVRFDGVDHAYGPDHPALSGINLTLAPGSVTAIVGPSGSGKSTLARLLLRFFDPDAGRITLGGVDLRQIDPVQLYRRIGFVLQEVRLIHATVRDNIALGRPAASPQAIERAARVAGIHERILALPRGYDSVVGDDARLSGGEQQRLSIARAVLLDAPVLVLDEATAAADAGHEVGIQEALSRLAAGRTLLVITHRLDTVKRADCIVVLEAGKVVEQGRHEQLLARQGRYAQLWACAGQQPGEAPTRPGSVGPC